jgi:hypothetical protein
MKQKKILLKIEASEFGCELILPPKKAENLAKSLLKYYYDKVGWKLDSFMNVEFVKL